MSFTKKTSFAQGEIDPSLHDNTDIKAYYSGLKTARNVTIGKNGRILNTAGTWHYCNTEVTDATRIYVPDEQTYFFEFSAGVTKLHLLTDLQNQRYREPFTFTVNDIPARNAISVGSRFIGMRVKVISINQVFTFATGVTNLDWVPFNNFFTTNSYTVDDIPNLKFETVKYYDGTYWTYVACKGRVLEAFTFDGSTVYRMDGYNDGRFGVASRNFPIVEAFTATIPTIEYGTGGDTMSARAGHNVVYGVTVVTYNGQESPILPISNYKDLVGGAIITSLKLPTNGQTTVFNVKNIMVTNGLFGSTIRKINVYRRPIYSNGSTSGSGFEWGLIGESLVTTFTLPNNNLTFGFTDFGQDADYTNPPPEIPLDYPEVFNLLNSKQYFWVSGIAKYNSRLLMWNQNYLFASKTNHPNYFLTDLPASATSSFNFKVGTSGDIYAVIESNGLNVFTSEGIFYGGFDGSISALNPIIPKRGKLLIDPSVNPINTPYGVFFVDRSTNSIKTLDYNDVAKSMMAEDVSLYSDHLFYLRKIKNWIFKEGNDPHIEVIMDDGALLHLSYNRIEKIMAWTRHDTLGEYKDLNFYLDKASGEAFTLFVVNRSFTNQHIEVSGRRIKKNLNTIRTFAHSSVYYSLSQFPLPEVQISLALLSGINTWSDQLRYPGPVGAYFTANIGETFIAYTPDRTEKVYLKLISAVIGVEAIFEPDRELPYDLRSLSVPSPFDIVKCHITISNLVHLEGKQVSVISDGGVLSSPNNNHTSAKPAQVLTVAPGGTLTLPEPVGETIVGLPYVSDIETLEVDDKSGSKLITAKLTNSVTIKYSRTRSVFVSTKFPTTPSDTGDLPTDNVEGMEETELWNRQDQINRALEDQTFRKTYRTTSDYKTNGKIAIRQVDPLPLEVVSLILDTVGV